MPDHAAARPAAILGLCVLLVLACAKTHGRLVRLERGALGFFRVNFGGTNPPEVEAIWARDRKVFWSSFGALAAVSLWLALADAWGPGAARLAGRIVLGLAVAFSLGFLVAGFTALARRRTNGPAPGSGPATAAWFALDGALLAALAAMMALAS